MNIIEEMAAARGVTVDDLVDAGICELGNKIGADRSVDELVALLSTHNIMWQQTVEATGSNTTFTVAFVYERETKEYIYTVGIDDRIDYYTLPADQVALAMSELPYNYAKFTAVSYELLTAFGEAAADQARRRGYFLQWLPRDVRTGDLLSNIVGQAAADVLHDLRRGEQGPYFFVNRDM